MNDDLPRFGALGSFLALPFALPFFEVTAMPAGGLYPSVSFSYRFLSLVA